MRQHRNSMPCLVAFLPFLGVSQSGAKQVPSIQKNRGFSVLSLGVQRCGGVLYYSTSLRLSRSLSSSSSHRNQGGGKSLIIRGKVKICFEQAAAVELPARLPSLLAGRQLLLHAIARIRESSAACAPSCSLFSKRLSQIFGLEEHWKWETIFPVLHVLINSQRIPLSSTP